ncbi:MAG: universal stress protein [Bacteroidales bacterium]|nr:universal stress protein [Bacteroidales bacterium]
MKNIVVGIDFSQSSLNALKHAIALSIKTKAKIHLIWVKTPNTSSDLKKGSEKSVTKKAHELLNGLIEDCLQEAPQSQVISIILEGRVCDELTQYASNLEDAVIVMGTNGASRELFAGSNALKTVTATTVPTFVVREGVYTNRDLIKVLVPIDTSFETLQKMSIAIQFAKAFAAKLVLLGINSPILPDVKHIINVQLRNASKMCDDANIRYDTVSIDVTDCASKAVIDFARVHEFSLITVMKEEEEDYADFWLGITTRQLVSHAPVPLLVVPNISYCLSSK